MSCRSNNSNPSASPGDATPCDGSVHSCPATCNFNIIGPADVPGLSKYKYKIDLPAGKVATGIVWSADKPTASFDGSTSNVEATVNFDNTKPDWIKLKATFTVDGKSECAQKQVALVKVDVGAATFSNPGKVSGSNAGSKIFLVNPPAPPAAANWVITNDPGSDWAKFTYNGTLQAAEPRRFVDSQGAGGPAYHASTPVTLTSPPEKPDALQRIQVGYIQHGSDAGSASYAGGLTRTVTTPTADTVDWLSSPGGPSPGDEWPWYDATARATGSGTDTWNQVLAMSDSPGLSIPAKFRPNIPADPNTAAAIVSAAETFSFSIQIAARTLDADLGADKHYFDEAHSTWSVNYVWPLVPAVSIVTVGPAWTTPGGPTEVSVNVVPTSTSHNAPFLRWEY